MKRFILLLFWATLQLSLFSKTPIESSPTLNQESPFRYAACNPTIILIQPFTQVTCAGNTAYFEVTATGDNLVYQWQINTGSGFTNLSNATPYSGTSTNLLTISNPGTNLNGYTYRCVLTDFCLTITNSNTAQLFVNPLPTPTISPAPLLSESFENGGALPSGWEIEIIAPNNALSFPSISTHPSGFSPYNGNYFARFNAYDNGNGIIRLRRALPLSTLGSLNVGVSFAWLESSEYPTSNDRVEVEWSLDGSTWYSAGSFSRYNAVAGWKIKTLDLPMGAGGQPALYIAFKFISAFGNDCYLDLAKVFFVNTTACLGNSTSYQTESGMTAYGWNLSSGGTITSGSGTSTITVLWSTAGSKTVSVNYNNALGCKATSPSTTTTVVTPLPTPSISGKNAVCLHDTVIYRTQKNMTAYQWTTSSGGSIIGSATDSLITIAWDSVSSSGNRWLKVMYTNSSGCSGITPTGYLVTVNPFPLPTITGPNNACKNSVKTYQTESGMTNYAWSVSPGGVILSGLGTTTVTIRWDSIGSKTVSVNYSNSSGCEALVPTSYPVTVHPLPLPVITGPDTVCLNTPGYTYTTEPGMTGYTWVVSSGGVITAGGTNTSNFVTVTWNSLGLKSITLSYTNSNGCTPSAATALPVLVSPIPTPQLFGPTNACVGSTVNLYSTQQGMNTYYWSASPGGTISSPTDTSTISVTWNSLGSQFVVVNYTSPAGCLGTIPDTLPVTVHPLPLPTISGPLTMCAGTGGHVYTTEPMNTGYQWTISSGGTIINGFGTNTVTVIWNTGGTQSINVNYMNANGCSAETPTSFPVTVYPHPIPGISGPNPSCQGTGGHTYITESGMTNYTWNISSGNTITGGGSLGDNYVTVIWNESDTQSVMVNYTNVHGCIAQTATSYPVMVYPLPQPTITGSDTVCINTGGHVYSTEAGMSGYQWTLSTGGTITSGIGTNTITVTWNSAGSKTVSVNYFNANGCTANTPAIFPVLVEPLPVPVITGPASACQSTGEYTYTTASGMTNYQWSVSNGGTITGGGTPTSNTITITWDSLGAQTIGVAYTNPTGCTTATPTLFPVTIHPSPSPTITGSSIACMNTGTFNYATQTGMNNYQWTISAGGVITGGTGSAQISVSWIATGSQWVAVNYTNSNGCSAPSPVNFPVTVNPQPGSAGTITGIQTICGATSGILYTVSPIANATSYIWTVPPGALITLGAGTNSITVNYPETAGSGNLTVTGSNSCGNGPPSPDLPVTFTPTPTPPVITLSGDMLTSSTLSGNQWFLNDTLLPGATNPTYLAIEEGEYWTQLILNGCTFDTSNHLYVIITGLPDAPESLFNVRLFPNPTYGELTLQITSPVEVSASLQVINELGATIRHYTLPIQQGTGEHALDLHSAPPGIYSLVFTASGWRIVERVIVK